MKIGCCYQPIRNHYHPIGEVMKNTYSKTPPPVKAGYTVRMHGGVWRIRATHIEVIDFLRRLCAARSAA